MWQVIFDDAFAAEFDGLALNVRKVIAAYVSILEEIGPQLGRPHADTLKGSAYKNMKELRPTVEKVEWRIAYAFDPERKGILLAAVAKGGDKRAYARLIRTADERFAAHLDRLSARKE